METPISKITQLIKEQLKEAVHYDTTSRNRHKNSSRLASHTPYMQHHIGMEAEITARTIRKLVLEKAIINNITIPTIFSGLSFSIKGAYSTARERRLIAYLRKRAHRDKWVRDLNATLIHYMGIQKAY